MLRTQILLAIFLVTSSFVSAQDLGYRVVEDLMSSNEKDGRTALRDVPIRTDRAVHFKLDLSRQRGNFLMIESRNPYYIFVNSTFASKGRQAKRLSVDSLERKSSETIFLSVYQPQGVEGLSVRLEARNNSDELENPLRPASTFSNFILIATLSLFLFFTALLRTNPQLTLDYLNVVKLFYLRDRDDGQINLRITSSVNLLFYLFCSLLASLALILAAHYSNLALLGGQELFTVGQYVGRWTFEALAILGLVMTKLAFTSIFGRMYGWDVTSFQFFNFIRVLILSLTFVAALSIICFSLQINVNYFFVLRLACTLMVAGAILLYFKLQARTSFRAFHLFSYLCATEIFPLVILVKVLLF